MRGRVPPMRIGTGTRSPPRFERGSVAGAVVFALVLGGVLVGGYLWLQGRRAAEVARNGNAQAVVANGGAADRWTRLLGNFLAKGPGRGTWETRFLSCVYTQHVAPHPTDPDVYLIARVDAEGAHPSRAVSRWLVPRQFFRAPAPLFFSNYRRSLAPVKETLEDGTETVRVHWRPRSDFEGLTETERRVWFTADGSTVVQVEDRSRTGHLIRRVRRIAADTGDWDPSGFDPHSLAAEQAAPPDPQADPDRALARVAASAPFAVYVPRVLPPGFVLVRASYSVINPERGASQTPVQLVSQLYSDGLALISIGVAPRGDMNAIERMTEGMSADSEDPAACPGLPAEPRDIRQDDGTVIRLRTDTCRTVVRRDDLAAVSVTLIGRNELPVEEYLRMMGTLEPAPR